LLNAGILDIAYRDPYPDPLSEELLAEAGVVPRPVSVGQPEAGSR
jgi:deoxycytidylate deaminase